MHQDARQKDDYHILYLQVTVVLCQRPKSGFLRPHCTSPYPSLVTLKPQPEFKVQHPSGIFTEKKG